MKQATNAMTGQSLLSQINDLAIYNLWANRTTVTWLGSKPQDLLTQPVPSSFPGIMGTLVHIWDVERTWLGLLQQAPVKSFRAEGFDGTLEDVYEGILQQSEAIVTYTTSLSPEDLLEGCSFSLPYVGSHTMPKAEILQHTLNHSTYHRGQVVTIGRNLGFTDAQMTDYMFYLLRVK